MQRHTAWVSALALALALLAPATPVRAHAHLVQATPPESAVLATAPTRVDLVFDEDLDGDKSHVRVYDAAGSRADRDDLQVDGKRMTLGVRDLAPGSYRVRWLSVAADDKGELHGDYLFRIGPPAAGQPRLGVSPDHSDAGQLVTIGGSGFGTNALVLVAIGDEQRTLGAVRADDQGRFALQTLVPEYLPHGRQVIQAANLDGQLATAALELDRGGWPPLGATLSVENQGNNRLSVELRLVNRSGWQLDHLDVRATVPPGTRVLRDGLEGPEGVEGKVEGEAVVWRGARVVAHGYVDPIAFVLDTASLPPGTPTRPTVTVAFAHGTDPVFRDQFTIAP